MQRWYSTGLSRQGPASTARTVARRSYIPAWYLLSTIKHVFLSTIVHSNSPLTFISSCRLCAFVSIGLLVAARPFRQASSATIFSMTISLHYRNKSLAPSMSWIRPFSDFVVPSWPPNKSWNFDNVPYSTFQWSVNLSPILMTLSNFDSSGTSSSFSFSKCRMHTLQNVERFLWPSSELLSLNILGFSYGQFRNVPFVLWNDVILIMEWVSLIQRSYVCVIAPSFLKSLGSI